MATSLATLRTMVLQRADMENSEFVGTDELNRYIQDSYGELYDLLASKNQDYFVAEPDEFTLSGSNTQALPADFYKLLGVDVYDGGRWKELDPFNFNERNVSGTRMRQFGRYANVRYRTLGDELHLVPSDQADGTYRLWYVPTCPTLSASVDLDATSDKWREYVVVDAAIKCLAKEESDTSQLERAKASLVQRIEQAAASRDVGRSARVSDVRSGRVDWFGEWE